MNRFLMRCPYWIGWFSLLFFIVYVQDATAHVKWFMSVDLADAPQALSSHPAAKYVPMLLLIATWGIVIFGAFDWFLLKKLPPNFSIERALFNNHPDIGLLIARIATGSYFIILWFMGGSILAPDLVFEKEQWIPVVQWIIALSVILWRPALSLAGVGILILYLYSMWSYGLFHLIDYVPLAGLGVFFILSGVTQPSDKKMTTLRYGLLFFTLVVGFLWGAVEKVAYPDVFYRFLNDYPAITLGLNRDLFIMACAIVEFTLFLLLIFGHQGIIVLALLANIVITAGNIYFGKIDTLGHWLMNFILLILVIKGPLPIKTLIYNQSPPTDWLNWRTLITYYVAWVVFIIAYYGLHAALFGDAI